MNTAAAVRVADSSASRIFGAVELAAQQAEDEGAAGADAAGLGRREEAAVQAADHEDEQHQRRPDVLQVGRRSAQGLSSPAGSQSGRTRTMIAMVSTYIAIARMPGTMPAMNSLPMSCCVRMA